MASSPPTSHKTIFTEDRYAKYDVETRLAIMKSIKTEWVKMRGEVESSDEFIAHMVKVLKKAGFRSPAGGELTERTVRYQALRAGVRFRKSDRKKGVVPLNVPAHTVRLAAAEERREAAAKARELAASEEDFSAVSKVRERIAAELAPAREPSAPTKSVQAAPPGMSPVLHAILTDPTLNEEQRSALVKAFYGVK